MRRPLDWIVVSLSLLVLFANRIWIEQPAKPSNVSLAEAQRPTPFAYVREDGSELYLPALDSGRTHPVSVEKVNAASGFDGSDAASGFDAAVFTWSSPVLAQERPAYR